MERATETYLEKVSKALRLSADDQYDVICEIRNHIYEAVNRGESIEAVLGRLGDPGMLAKSYNHTYRLDKGGFRVSDALRSIAFYSSVAFSGMFVMTCLPVVAAVLFLTALALIGVSITNLTGLTGIPFNLGPILFTGIPQVILAAIVAALLMLLAWASWRGMKKYMRYVSTNYHQRRVGRQ